MAQERNSLVLTVCDEIASVLASEGIAAKVDPSPHVDLSKIRRRHVFVTPGPVDVHPITRGADEERVDIAVSILDKPESGNLDTQLDLMFDVSKLFSRRVLPHGTVYAVTPEHDLESWWKLRVFSGSVTLGVWLGVHGR